MAADILTNSNQLLTDRLVKKSLDSPTQRLTYIWWHVYRNNFYIRSTPDIGIFKLQENSPNACCYNYPYTFGFNEPSALMTSVALSSVPLPLSTIVSRVS